MLGRILHRTRNLWRTPPMREFATYEEYWAMRGEVGRIFERWRATERLLADEGDLLEVGCGSAEFLRYVRERRPKLRLTGIDLAERSVEMARKAGFEAMRVDLLAEDLPGRYDFVTCFEVLEHIADAEVVARKLRDATKKQLFVSIPNIGYIGCRVRLAVFGRFPTTRCVMHIKEHIRHWTVRDFREWAEHCGLRVVRVIGVNGMKPMPFRRWPALFASGVVYVLEPIERPTADSGAASGA